jgi:hypothetical protein
MPILVVEEAGPREGKLAVPAGLAAGLDPGTARVSTVDGRRRPGSGASVAGGSRSHVPDGGGPRALPEDWPTGVSVSALVPAGTAEAITVPASAVVRRGQLTGVQVVTPDGVAFAGSAWGGAWVTAREWRS